MTPGTLLRTAALQALASAASLNPADPDFAPLIGAQVQLGQTWRTQSSTPGAAALPNQILVYGWDQKSETIAEKTSATQFETVATLIFEARVEVKSPAASAALPAQPSQAAIDAAIDGALDALCYAIKKAICQGIGAAATALYGAPVISGIKSVDIAQKLDGEGQRVLGNGGVAVDVVVTETFEPLIPNALTMLDILVDATAGGIANSGNHGNGTISAVTIGLGAVPGAYAVAFTSATAFSVTGPTGAQLGSGTVGTPFSGGGIGFTISAGTQAFQAGDGFTVTVQAAAQTILDPSA